MIFIKPYIYTYLPVLTGFTCKEVGRDFLYLPAFINAFFLLNSRTDPFGKSIEPCKPDSVNMEMQSNL